MIIEATLIEKEMTIEAELGAVHNVSDGGYERGYSEGYGKGKKESQVEVAEVERLLFDAYELTPVHAVIPRGVTHLRERLYYGPNSLQSVTFPETLKSIGQFAFYYNNNLPEVTFPEGLTDIGRQAFQYCSLLTDLIIPASVQTIEIQAFNPCSALTAITFKGSVVNSIATSALPNNEGLVINCPWPEGAVSGAPWGAKKATINYNYKEG